MTEDAFAHRHVTAWILGFLCALMPPAAAPELGDVTDKVEHLGSPYKARYPDGEQVYARNVWDLQAFEGRLYVGAGNSSNVGPAVNAGPVPIISFDPGTGQFREEFTVDDEQIDVYCVLDGRLCVPGHDPKESWDLGNFYRLEPGSGWVKHRNLPGFVHAYSMLRRDGMLFAGGSGQHEALDRAGGKWIGSTVAISDDDGLTWRKVCLGGYRVHALFELGGRVYASDAVANREWQRQWQAYTAEEGLPQLVHANIYEFDGDRTFRPRTDLGAEAIFPGMVLQDDQPARMAKPAAFGDRALYIGGLCHNDHQLLPFGLFAASSLQSGAADVRRVELMEGARPWDLLVREGKAYVLLDSAADQAHIVRVMASADLERWEEVLRFRASTFARSFEMLDGAFYFGLGCEVRSPDDWQPGELHPDTGEILRVRAPG